MTTSTFFAIAVLGLVVLVGPRLLRRRVVARRHVPVRGGVLVMRSPRRYGIALGVSALIPAAILAAMTLRLADDGRTSAGGLAAAGLATLACVAVAVHQLVAAFRQGFVVDESGIARVGAFWTRRLRWADVAEVTYNPMNRWFFVTAANGSHFWIPVETHGIADFAGIALLRLPPQSLRADELAREALDELAASEQ